MNRQDRFASSQEQARRQLTARNPAMPTNGGHVLSGTISQHGNSVNMRMRQAAVEEARRKMQMKYKKEAEEAAEKNKQREQKKREAWLARQEALVRPGHVLGRRKTAEQILLRDYVEESHADESKQDMNEAEQSWLDQHYNALVWQRIEREREAAQPQRRQEQSKEVKLTGQRDIVRPGTISGSAALGSSSRRSLPNQTSDYFLGTGYSATHASSNSNGPLQARAVSPGHTLWTSNSGTPLPSSSHGHANRATDANSDHIFGAGSAAASPRSDTYGFSNQSAIANSGHVLGGGKIAASPRSGSYRFPNRDVASSGHITGAVHSGHVTGAVSSGHVTGAISAGNGGYVLGMNNAASSPIYGNYVQDVQAHQREEMLASRRRLQEQYDVQVRQAAEAKKQEENDIAEKLEHSSLQ